MRTLSPERASFRNRARVDPQRICERRGRAAVRRNGLRRGAGKSRARTRTDFPQAELNFLHRLSELTLWIDDFRGDGEWSNVAAHRSDILPDTPWREIPLDHPILHAVFDLDEIPMIPGQDYAARGLDTDPPWAHHTPATRLKPAHLRGYFDEDGRLMVLATHNSDTGDGWEREAYEWYFETYSTQAHMLGTNIVVYAMSH